MHIGLVYCLNLLMYFFSKVEETEIIRIPSTSAECIVLFYTLLTHLLVNE